MADPLMILIGVITVVYGGVGLVLVLAICDAARRGDELDPCHTGVYLDDEADGPR